jgi:dihydrofolate reductase
MRNVVLYMFTTLDGFIAGPNGEFLDYDPSDEEMAFANELFGSAEGILFGRKTYEGFVSYWDALDPADASIRKADVEFARIFGNMTRVVFSRTLDRVGGDAILIRDNVAAEVSRLKRQPSRDLLLICGPKLLSTLVGLGLVDEFRILVRPMVLGRGKALFGDVPESLRLKHVSTRVFQSGVVMHHYEPVWCQ